MSAVILQPRMSIEGQVSFEVAIEVSVAVMGGEK